MVYGGMRKNKFGTMPELCIFALQARGISSFGRALAWHARGDRFDSGILHNPKESSVNATFFVSSLNTPVSVKIFDCYDTGKNPPSFKILKNGTGVPGSELLIF